MSNTAEVSPRYLITKDHGKWFVYDNQLKKRVGDWRDGTSKAEARQRAAELNKKG